MTNPAIANDTGGWIVTDEDGVVTAHVDSKDNPGGSATLNVACETVAAPITRANYLITLSPGDSYSGPPVPASSIRWDTLPPLGPDAVGYTPQQLTAAGYPPQPDPVAAPDAYAKWVQTYSHPVRYRRNPFGASLPTKGSVTEQGTPVFYSNAQCGGEVAVPYAGEVYTNASATIQGVPSLSVYGSPYNAAAIQLLIWAGIDMNEPYAANHANYQCGIGGTVQVLLGWTFSFYQTYYENVALPAYPNSYEGFNGFGIFTNENITPGDEVTMSVWPCDADGAIDANGLFGCFAVGDNSYEPGPVLWEFQIPTTPEAPYLGGEISFITERPQVGGSLEQLPMFTTFQINNIAATGGHASITHGGTGIAKTVWAMTADGASASPPSSDFLCDPALDSDNRLNPKWYNPGNGAN